jgi:hypothetical protein
MKMQRFFCWENYQKQELRVTTKEYRNYESAYLLCKIGYISYDVCDTFINCVWHY